MPIEISLKKSTSNPTSVSGLTLAEPVFNYSNNTFWFGKGSGVSPVWVGAGICGASGGIAAGLTYQIPTLGAVKDYFSAVSSAFLGTTAAYVSAVNGFTGGITLNAGSNITITSSVAGGITITSTGGGVTTFNGLSGAVQGVSSAAAGTGISVSAATGAITITNIGVVSFNGLTGTVQGVSAAVAGDGVSVSGSTGSVTITNIGVTRAAAGTGISVSSNTGTVTITNTGVQSFNGLTGAVQGVSAAVAGTGISVSGATGSVTITNIGVQSFNGLTGAVTGVTVGGTNTFTALNTFNAGISSAGGTFSSLTRFTAGITASTLYVSGGATFGTDTSTNGTVFAKSLAPYGGFGAATLYINADGDGNGGGNTVTVIGDSAGDGNNTHISVDDSSGTITLHAGAGGINTSFFNNEVSAPAFSDSYSYCETFRTTTSSTTANQTIATINNVYDNQQTPAVMNYPAFEVTISARDTVLNKTEMLKMLVVQDGTNTVNTQYGLIRTGATGPVSAYSTTLSGSPKNLLIRATPLSTNSTVFTTTVRSHSNG